VDVLEGSTLIFTDTRIPFKHSVAQCTGSLCAKNELDLFSHFRTVLACDGNGMVWVCYESSKVIQEGTRVIIDIQHPYLAPFLPARH